MKTPMAEKSITQILHGLQLDDPAAFEEIMPVVYNELRRIAASYLKRERGGHTLQPTALVHEAFLRLVAQKEIEWQNREHFFGIAARLMREILIEYARMKNAQKRGGGEYKTRVAVETVSMGGQKQFDLLVLDEALAQLESLDERQARIVEMKFFGGLNIEEIAGILKISPATVKREWKTAKLWLHNHLNRV